MAVPLPFLPLVAMTDPALLPVDLPAPAMVSPLDVEPIEPLDADRIEVQTTLIQSSGLASSGWSCRVNGKERCAWRNPLSNCLRTW